MGSPLPTGLCTHLLLLLRLPHWSVVFLLVEDLLHLPVLQVVQLPDGVLRPLDEVHQDPGRTLTPHKVMLDRRGGWGVGVEREGESMNE